MLYELGPRASPVYHVLVERIRSGELAPGTRLPAHTRLAVSFGVAPLTMRQVLAQLESDGLVVRERGRGTFVRSTERADIPQVLLVGLDAVQRADLEQEIRRLGKRPVVAATPAEALATVEREALPALAIVNLHLPRPSAGLRLVRTLRQRLPQRAIAVLNATTRQRSRLERSVAPPLVFVGDSALDQLSQVLPAELAPRDSTPDTTITPRLAPLLEDYVRLQLAGERRAARRLILEDGLASGASIAELYRHVLQPAQYRVGDLWETNQISIAREHLATAVTESVMVDLAASANHLPNTGMRIVVACAEGELHDIGARMVADLLELHGFTVRFLGADVPTESLLGIIREESASLVVLSAAMAQRLAALRTAVARVRQMYGARVRIFVGGQVMDWAPQAVCALEVDLATHDALETLSAARRLLNDGSVPMARRRWPPSQPSAQPLLAPDPSTHAGSESYPGHLPE